jgi:DNA-binding MurR/RpiR family transcriptional regulator
MDTEALAGQIVEHFDDLTPQLQAAARFVLDNPQDVAMLSMREQARRAGLPPVTMMRLARQLGFPGYREFRGVFAEALRRPRWRFSERAGALQQREKAAGGAMLLAQLVRGVAEEVGSLLDRNPLEALIGCAGAIEDSRRVFCVGLRSCYPVAFHFHYVYSLFRDNGVLLDGAGDTGCDRLRGVGPRDVLLAISVAPYTAATLEIVRYATGRGATLVALTDSRVAPLASFGKHAILVPTETPSFFHAITPAFAAAEALLALLAARSGAQAVDALRDAETQLTAFRTYYWPSRRRMKRA